MSEDARQILETIRRELNIKIFELKLKHKLTKKRAESKLLIAYYKASNTISRTKLMIHRINSNSIRTPRQPNSPARAHNIR